MTYLSPAELTRAAPAAQKMTIPKDGLIDTHGFVRYVEKHLNQRPVFAVQGKSHADKGYSITRRQKQGRHLVACANSNGVATVLLNSHTVRRKAWLGAGFWKGEQLLVGTAVPMQRWRGYVPALEDLERYRPMLMTVRHTMRATGLSRGQLDDLADVVSGTAYLPGHNPISPDELVKAGHANLYDTLFGMLEMILRGNAPSADPLKRKVKPVKGPDAVMQASNATFNAGLHLVGSGLALPAYRKT